MKNKERRYCTIPEIFHLREWFEKNFGTSCKLHDYQYSKDSNVTRYVADKNLLKNMMVSVTSKNVASKYGTYYLFIIATFAFVRLFGWMHYEGKY